MASLVTPFGLKCKMRTLFSNILEQTLFSLAFSFGLYSQQVSKLFLSLNVLAIKLLIPLFTQNFKFTMELMINEYTTFRCNKNASSHFGDLLDDSFSLSKFSDEFA